MRFGSGFFDLQLRFARRVCDLSGMPLGDGLLGYTNFYIRFGLGRAFDPHHAIWIEYMDGLARSADQTAWTVRFFATRQGLPQPSHTVATFGCFSYGHRDAGCLRLHFENADPDGQAPLAAERQSARRSELRALLAHVRHAEPQATRLAGVSWLYNLASYRRLFPKSYLATAKIAGGRFRNMPLWGQFLDRHGAIRTAAANLFLDRLARQRSMDDLVQCFPLQPLAVEAPLSDFYASHGIA